jgi:CubicO group peptidase (beta-lactamase class C family)
VIGSSGYRGPERRSDDSAAVVFPGDHWEPVSSPEAVGYSTPKLEMVRAFLQDIDTTAAMAIVHGRVLLLYGDAGRVSVVAGVRKSILGMLLGAHVAVSEMVTPTSGADDVHGYMKGMGFGKLWWLFDDPRSRAGGALQGAYTATGEHGQYITVIPKLDMVVAYKVIRIDKEGVNVSSYRRVLDLIAASRLSAD